MKERILSIVLSVLLIYFASSWLVLLCFVYPEGVTLVEPNKAILFTEIAMAGVFTLVGLGSFILMLCLFLKNLKEVE